MRFSFLILAVATFSSFWSNADVFAQDPHISQYTQVSSIYNPAMTGMHDGILKLGILYQDHLDFVNTPLRKAVINLEYGKDIASGDYAVDRLGIGGGLVYDDFNTGAFFNNSLYVNVAYLKSLSINNNHKLGLGLQFNYGNRTIDYSRLTFGTQFLEGYYDETISSGESNLGSRSADYLDVQAGLTYHYINKYFIAKVGVAAYHLTEPTSTGINNFRIPMSVNGFFKLETWFKNNKRLYVDVYYRSKNLIIGYWGVFARYTVINFEDYNDRMKGRYLLAGVNANSNLLVSPYIAWKSPVFEAGLTFDVKVGTANFAYPFESFVEFLFAYKVIPKRQAEVAIGADLY